MKAPAWTRLAGVALLAASFAASGCVRHFHHLPDSTEFGMPIEELWHANPELSGNRPWAVGLWLDDWPLFRPYAAQDLIDSWGEPDSKKVPWWMFGSWIFPPSIDPMTQWEWRKADKRVIVWVSHHFFYGFKATIGALFIEPIPEPGPRAEDAPTGQDGDP